MTVDNHRNDKTLERLYEALSELNEKLNHRVFEMAAVDFEPEADTQTISEADVENYHRVLAERIARDIRSGAGNYMPLLSALLREAYNEEPEKDWEQWFRPLITAAASCRLSPVVLTKASDNIATTPVNLAVDEDNIDDEEVRDRATVAPKVLRIISFYRHASKLETLELKIYADGNYGFPGPAIAIPELAADSETENVFNRFREKLARELVLHTHPDWTDEYPQRRSNEPEEQYEGRRSEARERNNAVLKKKIADLMRGEGSRMSTELRQRKNRHDHPLAYCLRLRYDQELIKKIEAEFKGMLPLYLYQSEEGIPCFAVGTDPNLLAFDQFMKGQLNELHKSMRTAHRGEAGQSHPDKKSPDSSKGQNRPLLL